MINVLLSAIKIFINPAANVEVVVLGHQKGGTTAIAALLGKISDKQVSIDPLYQVDQGKAKKVAKLVKNPKLIEWFCLRYPFLFAQPIVKDPDFIYIYQVIKECYGSPHVLFVVRDPRDTIRSICNRLALADDDLKHVPELKTMLNGNHHWELILSGQLPEHEKSDQYAGLVYNIAHRWNLAAKKYLEFSNEMTLLRYEDFLKDKEKSIEAVASKLGLECSRSITDFVDVQYQSKGNPDTDWQRFFGQENLEIIEDVCAESMREFGYDFLTNTNS